MSTLSTPQTVLWQHYVSMSLQEGGSPVSVGHVTLDHVTLGEGFSSVLI